MWRFIIIIFTYLNHCLHLKTSYNDCDDAAGADRIYLEKHHQMAPAYENIFTVTVKWVCYGH